jgi:hypothetical protein
MTEVVSLILLRAPPKTEQMPPMLIQYKVAWRHLDARLERVDSEEIRYSETIETVSDGLEKVLDHCEAGNPIPWPDLKDYGEQLYNDVVPLDAQRILAEAGQSERPILLVHSERKWDQIPWEIMYDRHILKQFLGLKFQIARLPILTGLTSPIRTTIPDLVNGQIHHVHNVRNLLGNDVLDGALAELKEEWLATFDDLDAPAGVRFDTMPQALAPTPDWPTTWDVQDVSAKILHITCHGKEDSNGERVWSLALTNANPINHHLGKRWVRQLDLTQTRPFVFGNACGSLGASSQPRLVTTFGQLFLEAGAPNFIGSFGLLRREVALEFARSFYRFLLKDNKAIGEALLATKQAFHSQPDNEDPSYLFYTLYGLPTTQYLWQS